MSIKSIVKLLARNSLQTKERRTLLIGIGILVMLPLTLFVTNTQQLRTTNAVSSSSLEAESGSISSNVQNISDTSASNGQYTKLFLATPTPTTLASLPTSCSQYPYKRLVHVSNTTELNTAVGSAVPGDMIVMADGTYAARTNILNSGTSTDRITLCGTRNAIIAGNDLSGGDVVALKASYWNLAGFKATGSIIGIHVVTGSYNDINGLEVYNVGQEAIEVHVFSSYNTIEYNYIHDTGKYTAEYGEGVYLGTANSNWGTYTNGQADTSNYNQVLHNKFGANVTAENVDVKEGTSHGTISYNTFDGSGEDSAVSFIDSWVDVKGSHYTVSNNTGSVSIHYGFEANKQVSKTDSGDYNTFSGNTITLSSGAKYGINIGYGSPVGNVVKCDNKITNTNIPLTNVTCQP